MSKLFRSDKTIALDKVCELADTTAGVYADLADMVVDVDIAERLRECARARAEAANDLIVARQDSDELPATGDPERAALQALGMKLESLITDTEAMYHSLRDLDLEVSDAISAALPHVQEQEIITALNRLSATVDDVSLNDAL